MLKKNIVFRNASIYIVLAFIQKSISFFLVPIYTALLSPSEFGLVNQTLALGSIYILVFTFALDEAAARFYFQYRNNSQKAVVLGTIITFSLLLSVLGGILLLVFNKLSYRSIIPELPISFMVLSVLIIISSPIYTIFQKILRIKEAAKSYSFLMLGYSITQIILSILFLVVIKLNALGYILALSITSVLFGAYSFYQLRKEIKVKISKPILLTALKYSTAIVPHTISGWGLRGYTTVVIGKILNFAAVGIFNAVNFIALTINVLSKAILDAYQPWVYKKLELEGNEFTKVVTAARLLGLLFVLLGFFLSLISAEIIKLFINKQYHSGIYIAPILVFSSIVLVLGSLLIYVLYYKKENTKFIGLATITGALINIVLCALLIPKYNILGAAVSLAFSNLVISVLKQIFASNALKTKAFFIEVYLLAIVNLFISYYAISYQFTLHYKIIIFITECLILYMVYYRTIKHFLKQFFDND